MASNGIQSPSSSDSSDEGLDRSLPSLCFTQTKIFHDTVHSLMELPHLCYLIINTPQFDRLRHLKQLGVCYYVYPSASHNRFEHCIGTAYLAGKYCRILQKNQPKLGIDANDILCLEIAGLCHDLGHGPFSHLWESFMKLYVPTYSHEQMSIRIFDSFLEDKKLKEAFEIHGLDSRDCIFIKEAIFGQPLPGYDKFHGRDPSKYFLYQIISNGETKVDVDKFDYLLRDSRQLNIPTTFEYDRVIENSGVVAAKDEKTGIRCNKIGYRRKIYGNLEELFKERLRMHKTAYQHKVIRIIENMILDAFVAAEPFFQVTSDSGIIYKLSNAYEDVSAFCKLTDGITENILNWGNGGSEAAYLFSRITKRDLYKYLGYFTQEPNSHEWNILVQSNPALSLITCNFNYGKGDENPLNSALFYDKNKLEYPYTIKRPNPQFEYKYLIILKTGPENEDLDLETLKMDLRDWAEKQGLSIQDE